MFEVLNVVRFDRVRDRLYVMGSEKVCEGKVDVI